SVLIIKHVRLTNSVFGLSLYLKAWAGLGPPFDGERSVIIDNSAPPRRCSSRSRGPPGAGDHRMVAARACGGLQDAYDLAAVLGRDGERGPIEQVGGDGGVVVVPGAAHGRDGGVDRAAFALVSQHTLMRDGLGGHVQAAGAQGVFLRVDPELGEG